MPGGTLSVALRRARATCSVPRGDGGSPAVGLAATVVF